MFQIIFNDTSATEMAALPQQLQMEILREFDVLPVDLEQADPHKFGRLERDGRPLYRYRAADYRIYFEKTGEGLLIHRVLNKNSLKDFLFRTKLPLAEDEELQINPDFWKMIDRK